MKQMRTLATRGACVAIAAAALMTTGCGKDDDAGGDPGAHEPSAGTGDEDEAPGDPTAAKAGDEGAEADPAAVDPAASASVVAAVTANLDSAARALQRCVDAAWTLGQWPPETVQVRFVWPAEGAPEDFAAVDGGERPIAGILAECLQSRVGRLAETWPRPTGKARVAHKLALKLPKRPKPSVAALTAGSGRFLYDLRATPKNRTAAEQACRKRLDDAKVQPDPKKGGPNQMLDACIRAMARAAYGQGIRFEPVADDPDAVVWTFFQPKKPGKTGPKADLIVQASSKAAVHIADGAMRLGRVGDVTGTQAKVLGDQHQTMVVRFLDDGILAIESGAGDETVYVRDLPTP